jgi:hypothetical protein
MKINDDNLAHQVMAEMDAIRAEVWRDRLVDAAGLEAQKAHLEELKAEFQQAAKEPPSFPGGRCRGFHEAGYGDGRRERIEFREYDSKFQGRWISIFESATHDIEFWQQELGFQRFWMDSALWASSNGHIMLAKRLKHTYRLFYGAPPIIRARVFGHPVTEPELLDWSSAQGAECVLDNIKDRQALIYHTLEALHLLDNPYESEIGRRLDSAYQAASFKRRFYEVDHFWGCRIFDALGDGKVCLAAALMRLYGHFFGTVYLFQGQRIDRPSYGAGHVPDFPTAAQAKSCLFDCNRLREAWIERHSVENVPNGRGADIKARLQRLGRNP